MRRALAALAGGALWVATAGSAAFAGTLTFTGWTGGYNPNTAQINYAPPPGPGPATGGDYYVGELNMSFSSLFGSSSYSVFCTDIFHDFSNGGNYTLGQISDPSQFWTGNVTGISATKYNQLLALLNGVAATNYIQDADTSGAVQLAVWEIEDEYDNIPYNLGTGTFTVTGSSSAAMLADANTLLSDVYTGAWNNFTGNLFEFKDPSDQSFSFLTVTSNGFRVVPEPASLALLGSGLFGLGFASLRRRRR